MILNTLILVGEELIKSFSVISVKEYQEQATFQGKRNQDKPTTTAGQNVPSAAPEKRWSSPGAIQRVLSGAAGDGMRQKT